MVKVIAHKCELCEFQHEDYDVVLEHLEEFHDITDNPEAYVTEIWEEEEEQLSQVEESSEEDKDEDIGVISSEELERKLDVHNKLKGYQVLDATDKKLALQDGLGETVERTQVPNKTKYDEAFLNRTWEILEKGHRCPFCHTHASQLSNPENLSAYPLLVKHIKEKHTDIAKALAHARREFEPEKQPLPEAFPQNPEQLSKEILENAEFRSALIEQWIKSQKRE